MMQNKKLLFLVLAVFLGVAFIRSLMLTVQAKSALRIEAPQSIGMCQDLLDLVNSLESTIGARIDYELAVKNDPLKISRIVQNGKSPAQHRQEVMDALSQMRLSCTIMSSSRSTAIIKYKGESYVVGVGESVAGKRVVAIENKKVVLDDNGRSVELINKPEPLAERKYNQQVRLNDLEL